VRWKHGFLDFSKQTQSRRHKTIRRNQLAWRKIQTHFGQTI